MFMYNLRISAQSFQSWMVVSREVNEYWARRGLATLSDLVRAFLNPYLISKEINLYHYSIPGGGPDHFPT